MARTIVATREAGVFTDLADMCRRTQLPRHHIEALISAGALEDFAPRRVLLWELGTLDYEEARFPLHYETAPVELLPLSAVEAHFWERDATGVSTGPHLLGYYRHVLNAQEVLPSVSLATCRKGARCRGCGANVMHQAPPTAKGVHFVTLEDEYGLIHLVIQAEVYGRVKQVVYGHALIRVTEQVQRRGEVVSILVLQAEGFMLPKS